MFLIRWMIRLFVGLVILVVIALVVANYFAQSAAQHAASSRIRSATNANSVTVHIHSTPFLWDALVEGKIKSVDITALGVPDGPVTLTEVKVDANRIKYSLSDILRHHSVNVASIASATVTVTLTNAVLDSTLKASGGTVVLRDQHVLALELNGKTVADLNLTTSSLIPPCAYALTTLPTGYSLSCTVSPVPNSLLNVISSAKAGS